MSRSEQVKKQISKKESIRREKWKKEEREEGMKLSKHNLCNAKINTWMVKVGRLIVELGKPI